MVESAVIRMRLYDYASSGGMIASRYNLPLSILAMQPKILQIRIQGRPADAAGFTEIDPNPAYQTASTAVAIEILSSSDTDNQTAGGHAQSVNIIGTNGDDDLVNVTQVLHATAGTTVVTSTELYKEVWHMYCNAWGSGDKDNAGTITVQKIDDTDLCTIAVAANESEGSAFRIPDGCCGMLSFASLKRLEPAAGVYAADEGVRVRVVHIDPVDGATGLVAADRHLNYFTMEIVGAYENVDEEPKNTEIYEAGTWIHFEHSSKVDAGELYDAHFTFIIWKK
jgi:hypothetical protein